MLPTCKSALLFTEDCRLKSLNILQIVSEVCDETVISNEDVDSCLMEKLLPYVSLQYEKTTKVHATLNQLIADLTSAVDKTNTQEQVFTVQVSFVSNNLLHVSQNVNSFVAWTRPK